MQSRIIKIRRKILGVAILFLISAQYSSAQQTATDEPLQIFSNVHLILGDGNTIDRGYLASQRGVIQAIGTGAMQNIPPDAVVHNLSGKTLMPALVNTHAHLGWEAYGKWGSQYFTAENLIDHLYRHAYYGVGTIISTGSDKEDIAKQVKTDQLKGNIGGARYHLSPGMGSPGGGPNPRFTDDPDYWGVHPLRDTQQAAETVGDLAAKGYGIAKIWVDARDERRGAQIKLTPEIYSSVLTAAKNHDLRIIAHATTLGDHKSLVELGNRRFIHMPYDTAVDNDYLEMVQRNNVFIVPTLGMITKNEPYYVPAFQDPFFFDQVSPSTLESLNSNYSPPSNVQSEAVQQRSAMLANNLLKLKDHVILGTDAGAVGDFFGFADHVELALFVRMGMTPMEAIIASTSRAAEAFGLDNVGVLAEGKAADFIILNANPLQEISNTREIADVYLRGERVDRERLSNSWIQE